MATSVIDVIQREVLTQVRICDELLGFCERPVVETLLISNYETRVLADKPVEI